MENANPPICNRAITFPLDSEEETISEEAKAIRNKIWVDNNLKDRIANLLEDGIVPRAL